MQIASGVLFSVFLQWKLWVIRIARSASFTHYPYKLLGYHQTGEKKLKKIYYLFHPRYLHNDIWRASETLTGVTQLKIGDVCTFIYSLDVRMSFCTLTFSYFCVSSLFDPSQTSLNGILRFSDHYPYHPKNWIVYRSEFLVKTQKLNGVPFLFESVVVVS